MPDSINSNSTFNIGITMAGAGSAGCYTAGVMDYLFEILDLWEKGKKKLIPEYQEFFELIPQHNVLIDVLGGTSAGGMTSCMAAIYALNGKIKPVKDPQVIEGKRDNIFYDNWVMLDDDTDVKKVKTLAKAFKIDDLKDKKFVSLLNTQIIDDIADNALNVKGEIKKQVNELPDYVSKDLDILQVHTMLRGIPLSISFGREMNNEKAANDIPSHNSFEHFMVSHYKYNYGEVTDNNQFLWFNPYEKQYLDIMALTTKSTGAFPIGLRFREIDQKTFTDKYLQCTTETTIFNRLGQKDEKKQLIDWSNFPEDFTFCTIDGGAVNNEPFGEVLGILKSRYGKCMEDGYPKYGIVMIDPFPDEVDKNEKYNMPDDVFSVIPQIISSLHDQSKVKKDDMVEASENPYFRGEIFPRKWENYKQDKYPITSASVSAFGGFLDISFRHYDFFLGRDNARNYFRYYFSFEYYKDESDESKNIIHPIHRSWTTEMINAFKIVGKDKKTYLPIIPDLNILNERRAGNQIDPFKYTIQEKPKFNPTKLFQLRQEMEDRFEKLLDITKLRLQKKKHESNNEVINKWMGQYYHNTWWDRLKGVFINKIFNFIFSHTKGGLARNITEMAVKWILTDLDNKGMLMKSD